MSRALVLALCLGAVLWTMPARALCLVVSCTVNSPVLSFGGTYMPFGAVPTDSATTLTVSCTATGVTGCQVPYVASLSTGLAGQFTPRQMSSAAGTLDYNIYTDAARTLIWGDGSGGTQTVSGSVDLRGLLITGNNQSRTAYGRIPAGQAPAAGLYADSLFVEVNY